MTLIGLATILLLILFGNNLGEESSAAKKAVPEPASLSEADLNIWRTSGLVDDLTLDGAPRLLLEVKYDSKTLTKPGETLTPKEAAKAPSLTLKGTLHCKSPYALLMVDPDARSRACPMYRSWLHWMVVNIGNTATFQDGQEASPYLGPGPPNGTGPHRYAFLVYCQGGTRLNAAEVAPKDKKNFDVDKFALTMASTVPDAGNFFYSEFTARRA
ncbi:protein D1-like [Amblyomma americanum]